MIAYAFGAVLAGLLLALSYVDLREFRLPNIMTFPLIALGLLWNFLEGDIKASLIGASLGYGVFVAIAYGFKALRGKEGLGRGDAKLLAAGGAWAGWAGLPHIVLIASLLGIVTALIGRRRAAKNGELSPDTSSDTPKDWIPFGPCLAVGIFAVWCAQLIS